jgi:hypothetical protein
MNSVAVTDSTGSDSDSDSEPADLFNSQFGNPGPKPKQVIPDVPGKGKPATDPISSVNMLKLFQSDDTILNDDVKQAIILYENGVFYYNAGELVGALVSYSCASISLDSINRKLKNTQGNSQNIKATDILLNCCLRAVEELQPRVKLNKNKGKDNEEEKEWESICVNYSPLTFAPGSDDCLFFDDVVGLKKEKKLIESSLVYPLVYPNLYPKASKGILIYGPPGTGKTFIAKAAVNELQLSNPEVGVLFFAPSPGDLKGKYVGETEKKIEEVFTCASRAACAHSKECGKKFISVIFMDEMDAIGPNRDRDKTGLAVNSVNTLLQMMDGIKSFKNIAVVAATNYPWNLDDAILRRFDTQILIDLPTEFDLSELLRSNVSRMLTLNTKPESDTCYMFEDKDPNKTNKKSKDAMTGNLQCKLLCQKKPFVNKSQEAPFSSMIIDYFAKPDIFDAIPIELKAKNFSNSDVNRLFKSAATYTGELAVKSNLFYSLRMIDTHMQEESNKYVSSLTHIKDTEKFIKLSIDILDAIDKGTSNSTYENVFEISKPDMFKIQHKDNIYYNSKSLLAKRNDFIIDHPSVSDIFIKFHDKGTTLLEADGTLTLGIEKLYKEKIMGYKTDANDSNKKTPTEIEVILTFDIAFNEKNGSDIGLKAKYPRSDELCSVFFGPMYNSLENEYNTIKSQYSTQGTGDDINKTIPIQKEGTYKDEQINHIYERYKIDVSYSQLENIFKVVNGEPYYFEVGDIAEKTTEGAEPNAAAGVNMSNVVYAIMNKSLESTKDYSKYFKSMSTHTMDYYNYLLYLSLIADNNKSPPPAPVVDIFDKMKSNNKFLQACKNISDTILGENTLNFNYMNIFSSIDEYADIKLGRLSETQIISKVKFTTKDSNDDVMLSTRTLEPLSSNDNIKTFLFDADKKRYYVSLKQYMILIKNINEIEFVNNKIPDFEDPTIAIKDYIYFIQIPIKFFELMFKDHFKVQQGLFAVPSINVSTLFTSSSAFVQFYLDDIFASYNILKNIQKFNVEKMREKYLARLHDCSNIPQILLDRLYDNYNLVTNDNNTFNKGSCAQVVVSAVKRNGVLLQNDIAKAMEVAKRDQGAARVSSGKGGRGGGQSTLKMRSRIRRSKHNRSIRSERYEDIEEPVYVQSGGTYLVTAEFIKFCIFNPSDTSISKTAKKKMFVETSFGPEEIKLIVKEGGFKYIINNFVPMLNSIADTLNLSKDDRDKKKEKQMIEEFEKMKKKNQLMPVLFKNAKCFGFIIDENAFLKASDDNYEIKDAYQRLKETGPNRFGFGGKPISNKDKKTAYDNLKNAFEIKQKNVNDILIKFRICQIYGLADDKYKTIMTKVYNYLDTHRNNDGNPFHKLVHSPIMSDSIIGNKGKISWVDIPNDKTTSWGSIRDTIKIYFNALRGEWKQMRQRPFWTHLTPVAMYGIAVGGGYFFGFTGALAAFFTWPALLAGGVGLTLWLVTTDWLDSDATPEELIDSLIKTHLYNIATQSRYIDIDSVYFNSNPNISIYRDILHKITKSISDLKAYDLDADLHLVLFKPNYKKIEAGTNNDFDPTGLRPYDNLDVTQLLSTFGFHKIPAKEPPKDIKKKLTNYNIPLQSFYYGLSVTNATYNAETGTMLKVYNKNKAEFDQTYKKKLEG